MPIDDVPQEFRAVNKLFEECASKADFSRLDQVYSRDARILPPGAEMISGVGRIREFWESGAQAMGLKSLSLKTVDLEVTGDQAVEIGRADLVAERMTPSTMTAKYVVVWKKQDGAWRWSVDIWNAASS